VNDHSVPWYKSLSVKLGLVLFVVVAGAVGIVYVAVVPPLQSRLIDATFKDLTQASALPARVVGRTERTSYQNLAETFSEQLNARVVIFEELAPASLQVVADSRPQGAEDIADDPVAGASADTGRVEQAVVTRGGQDFAEVARPAVPPNGLQLQVPTTMLVSQPLAERLSAVAVVRRDILLFGGVALAVSWLIGTLAALKITRRVGRLDVAADRIAGGDFDVEIDDRGSDEIAQLARTFDRMRIRLANLDHARREFIANASHELRTPLFALGGFLELLADEDLDEGTRRDFLETARGQVERLTRLATDLLDLSRLDAGQLGLEAEPVSLGRSAQELVDGFQALAETSGHVLGLGASDEAVALGDEQRVLQIGRSLIENALRHTPSGTTVTVDVARRGETATLSVRDDGPGIRPEDQEQLFERFYRGEGSGAHGSGIGLAISRELAMRMGGGIELDSTPGETRFTLVLPAAPSTAPFSRENALMSS
jgi:signal transduction histidine kinase